MSTVARKHAVTHSLFNIRFVRDFRFESISSFQDFHHMNDTEISFDILPCFNTEKKPFAFYCADIVKIL